jgi:hypothetical protein
MSTDHQAIRKSLSVLDWPLLAQTGRLMVGRACPLCPGSSDINSFRYCQGVIDLDA